MKKKYELYFGLIIKKKTDMTNNFIELIQTNELPIHLNSVFIEGIEQTGEMENETLITMGFGSKNFYRVKETPKEVIKKIEESGTFKFKLK